MIIKARLKRLEDQMGHDAGAPPIDMAAIEKYQQDMKENSAAFVAALRDLENGIQTPVPPMPIPPPCYNEWRIREYGPRGTRGLADTDGPSAGETG